MRRILSILLFLTAPSACANQKLQGNCYVGAQFVVTSTTTSSSTFTQSIPGCTVTVYNAGTLTLSTIFSDNSNTPLGNPFTANSLGDWFFYAANGRYDVHFSGNGIPIAFTRSDYLLFDNGGGGGGTGTVTSAAITLPNWLSVSGSPITTAGTFVVTPAAAQTSHQVIGTCGTATTFAPCALVAGDIPTLNQNTTGTAANITGTCAIANGCTGETTAAAAFQALSPLTTKGDLIGFATIPVRIPVGADNTILTADSSQASGVRWGTGGGAGTVTWQSASATVVSSSTFNIVAGSGITPTLTNVGGVATYTPSLNTAVALTIATEESGKTKVLSSTNGTTAYTASLSSSSALTIYTTNQPFLLIVDTTCATSCTLNVDSLGIKSIKQKDGTTDPGGALVANRAQWIYYDGTLFRLMY